jgi:hypothetical protein
MVQKLKNGLVNGLNCSVNEKNKTINSNSNDIYHKYTLSNKKQFKIKIYGVCEYIAFFDLSSYLITFKNGNLEHSAVNVRNIITSINNYGSVGFGSFVYLFAGLVNLKSLPLNTLPLPYNNSGTETNKISLDYSSLFRYCASLENIENLLIPSSTLNTVKNYSITYMFDGCNSLSGLPQSFITQIENINSIRWTKDGDGKTYLPDPTFDFNYSNVFSTTSNKYTIEARKKYGYNFDSFNFIMYPDENGLSGSNNIMTNNDGSQICALVRYTYPDKSFGYYIYPRYIVDDLFFSELYFKPCIFGSDSVYIKE